MQESEVKQLLKKYINNSCTAEELKYILPYIQQAKGRQELEQLLLEDWETFNPVPVKDSAANEWYERLQAVTGKRQQKFIFTRNYSWLKYAAIAIMVLGMGTFFYNYKRNNKPVQQTAMLESYNPKGQRTQIVLADGSIVYLGAESRLQYPKQLSGKTREIYLEGEAFFEVEHDVYRPFIVHTGKVQTQVLGTSFKIEAFKNQQLNVSVATGKVSVGYKEQENKSLKSLAVLTPGKMVSWNPENHQSSLTAIAIDEVRGLKSGNLAFNDVTLQQITQQLERWYNIEIKIKQPDIAQYRLSININGKASLNLALDAITAATGLTYKMNKGQVVLSSK